METKELLAVVHFHNKCYVCGKRYRPSRGFAIHHIKYFDGEKIYSDFSNSELYHQYLKDVIDRRGSTGFALLCRKHHFAIERLLRYKPETLRRMIRLCNVL